MTTSMSPSKESLDGNAQEEILIQERVGVRNALLNSPALRAHAFFICTGCEPLRGLVQWRH